MLKKIFFFILFHCFSLFTYLNSSEDYYSSFEYEEDSLYFDSVNSTITLRHIEPEGLGYKNGYTTLAGLFFPGGEACDGIYSFFDFRVHFFNNNA